MPGWLTTFGERTEEQVKEYLPVGSLGSMSGLEDLGGGVEGAFIDSSPSLVSQQRQDPELPSTIRLLSKAS